MEKISVGIFGASMRGPQLARASELAGMKPVAFCDKWEEKLQAAIKQWNVKGYTDYDGFLEHDMDGVILANYFHEHAPYAIKALEAGKHVMSETMACKTPAEGVALVRAVEKSGKIYMFAENYPYFAVNQEMRRLYKAGEIGEIQYGEGEYNGGWEARAWNAISPGMNHWRNWIPPTYYTSHALAPIMYITDTHPVSVNAQAIPRFESSWEDKLKVRRGDPAAVILCRMNNESLVRIMGITLRGHSVWYRIHGTRGLMENLRTGRRDFLRMLHEPWDLKDGEVTEKIYLPNFPQHAEEAAQTGHMGGDFFVAYEFSEAIKKNEHPYFDVYRGLETAMVSIQAWRSCLSNGGSFEIPDFHRESSREKYENDRWSPAPEDQGPGQPAPSIKGWIEPSKEALEYARKIWKSMGYTGE